MKATLRFTTTTLLFSLLVLEAGGKTTTERIVAVGDVHGVLVNFIAILQKAAIVDSNGHWNAGKTRLVQLGDLIDRGPDDRAIMDFVMNLQKEAKKAGGKFELVLGNHEVMNIMGDLRYVVPEAFARFGDEKSAKRQHDYLEKTIQFSKRTSSRYDKPDPVAETEWKSAWLAAHPEGYVEHRKAYGPRGTYGKWLRKLPAVVQIDDLVFVHGGISPQLSAISVKELNKRVKNELKAHDYYRKELVSEKLILHEFSLTEMTMAVRAEAEYLRNESASSSRNAAQRLKFMDTFLGYGTWYSVHPVGPFWFRGYATWDETKHAADIEALTKAYDVRHFIVAHTPQLPGRITARFDGKVLIIDTGMNWEYYRGGRPMALEISNGHFTAISLDGSESLLSPGQLVSVHGD